MVHMHAVHGSRMDGPHQGVTAAMCMHVLCMLHISVTDGQQGEAVAIPEPTNVIVMTDDTPSLPPLTASKLAV